MIIKVTEGISFNCLPTDTDLARSTLTLKNFFLSITVKYTLESPNILPSFAFELISSLLRDLNVLIISSFLCLQFLPTFFLPEELKNSSLFHHKTNTKHLLSLPSQYSVTCCNLASVSTQLLKLFSSRSPNISLLNLVDTFQLFLNWTTVTLSPLNTPCFIFCYPLPFFFFFSDFSDSHCTSALHGLLLLLPGISAPPLSLPSYLHFCFIHITPTLPKISFVLTQSQKFFLNFEICVLFKFVCFHSTFSSNSAHHCDIVIACICTCFPHVIAAQIMAWKRSASALPENSLEMQNRGHHLRPTKSEPAFKQHPRGFLSTLKLGILVRS